jgi:hypothetical protein
VAVPLARTDLTSRRKRVVAKAMLRGLDLYERLTSRVLVDVTCPGEDPFYRVPEKLDAFRPGEVLDARQLGGEGRGMRPMEMFLVGLAGCSAMDMVMILTQQRQGLQDLAPAGRARGRHAPRDAAARR